MEQSNSPPLHNQTRQSSPQLPQFTQSAHSYSARTTRAPTRPNPSAETGLPEPAPRKPALRQGRSRSASDRLPSMRYLLAGSSILAGLVLMVDVSHIFQSEPSQDICQEVVRAESVLSRNELVQLLSIPERSTRTAVRNVVSAPYCMMPAMEVRAGAIAEREAYPLEFDPKTWLVILYEGDEYAGYAFSFRQ
ncbi:MAG: hypothetical protein ACFB8W_06460 [Elainellaceae cyanobacterium]